MALHLCRVRADLERLILTQIRFACPGSLTRRHVVDIYIRFETREVVVRRGTEVHPQQADGLVSFFLILRGQVLFT